MPRILLQQGTNLVNKFALLLHKCRFAQDSRDKPENDGSWRCWLSICCELFNYPSPADKSATSPAQGEVLNNITFKGLDVVRQYAALLERCVQSSTRVRKAQVVTRQTNPIGRSMIEMLGVLAIIAVLSVGGIAGYSKAMEKWRINKLMEEYSYMIQGILGHLTEFQKLPRNTGLVDVGLAMNFIPSNWKKINPLIAYDTFGNVVKPYARDKRVVIDFYLGGLSDGQKSKGFSPRICAAIMKDLVKPLHSSLTYAWIFRGGFVVTDYFRGDTRCTSNVTCLRDITPDDINQVCNLCDGERQCSITIEF